MQLLRPPLSQCYSSYHLPTLATLTHVLIYIFVNIYLHICIIVHICYGIYLHFCICANIWKGCRVAERLEDAALHMSKATDVKLCEMIAHEDKCQFRIPSAYFGTFSQNIFENIAHLSLYQIVESEDLSYFYLFWDKVQNLTVVFKMSTQEESHGQAWQCEQHLHKKIYPRRTLKSVELLM